jgi:hypothetical protein
MFSVRMISVEGIKKQTPGKFAEREVYESSERRVCQRATEN